jgi:long-chain acyl-CoA synthetase
MSRETMIDVFHQRVEALAERPALWRKVNGAWQSVSWKEYGARVQRAARGFIALGFAPGQAVCIVGFNRVEWVVADLAAMAACGVPAGIYTTSSAEQAQYILHHCEAPIAVVENDDQLAKIRKVKGECPALRHVVVMDAPKGPREDWVLTFEELLAKGDGVPVERYHERVAKLSPTALATLIYTSGTTGPPKAVMLSHLNLYWTAKQSIQILGEWLSGASMLSYLPLSHIAEQQFSIHQAVMHEVQIWFAEALEPAVLKKNIEEVRPICFFAVPRIWEKFKGAIEAKLAAASPGKQRLVARARKAEAEYQTALLAGRPPGPLLLLKHALFDRLVFQKLRKALGFDRTRLFVSAAAPIGRDVLDFWMSLGIVIREVYGQSEDCGPTTVNTIKRTRIGTVGAAFPGVEVKIADDGEILVRGPNVCMGYYKDAEATAALLEDGWLHSGDVGEFDQDGFLRITDRKKDLIVTSGGKKAAPQNLEALLKGIRPVSQALVVGERKNFLAAVLTLDPVATSEWAKNNGVSAVGRELCNHPKLRAHLQAGIDGINATLAKWETIKKFTVLEGDFSIEGGELTPTLKMKRKVVTQKYAGIIEGLYAGEESGRAGAPPS